MNDYKFVYGSELSTKICEVVTDFSEIKTLFNKMQGTMLSKRGLGLAAPQVNQLIRMFVIKINHLKYENDFEIIACINPEIIKSTGKIKQDEYCLSFPNHYAKKVKRKSWVELDYLDEKNEKQKRIFIGMNAVCVQHEISHLNGKKLSDFGKLIRKS